MEPSPSQVIAMGVIFPIVDGILVFLRFYSRRGKIRYGADDFCVLFAWIISLGLGAILITGATLYGYGQISKNSTGEAGFADQNWLLEHTKKCSDFFNWLSPFALGGAKLSLLFFYRRIFRGRAFDIVSWATIIIVVCWVLTFFFLPLFQCGSHIPYLWSSAKHIASACLQGEPIALSYSSFDVAGDLAIFCIPMYWTSTLHMNRKKKILLVCIFLFGSIAALASVVRLVVYVKIYPGHNKNPNQLGYATNIAFFTMLEIGLAIIAACLPTLGTLLSEKTKQRISDYMTNLLTPSRRYNKSSGTIENTAPHRKFSNTPNISLVHMKPVNSLGSQNELCVGENDSNRVSDEEALTHHQKSVY